MLVCYVVFQTFAWLGLIGCVHMQFLRESLRKSQVRNDVVSTVSMTTRNLYDLDINKQK